MKSLVVFFILAVSVAALAQPAPDTLWTRTYGTLYDELAGSVEQTSDGGFVIVGSSNFPIDYACTWCWDVYLVKTNSLGDTIWTRFYNYSDDDFGYSVKQTSDGGYIIAGQTQVNPPEITNRDMLLIKTNPLGGGMWASNFGAPGVDEDKAYSVQETSDGGYIIAGYSGEIYTDQNFYLVKICSPPCSSWTRSLGGLGNEVAYSIQQTNDGGYIVAGFTSSFGAGGYDFYLVKTNSIGDTQWTRTFGGPGDDRAYSVQQTCDGGYIVAGYTSSYGAGSNDFYLIKTNPVGDTIWTRTYGGTGYDNAYSIQQISDRGYIIGGAGCSHIVRTDSLGNVIWTKTFSGLGGANSVQQTSDGGYIVAGSTSSFGAGYSDFYVIRLAPDRGVHVLSPNGGEEWMVLDSATVRWLGAAFPGNVKIELNRHYPTESWETLAASTANDGEESFWITGNPSNTCRVRVSAILDTVSDISDNDFSIVCSQGNLALVRFYQPNTPLYAWNAGVIECPLIASASFHLKNFGTESIVVYVPGQPSGPEFTSSNNCPAMFNLSPGSITNSILEIAYDPLDDGTHFDTLQIMTNAVNSVDNYVNIPLTGQQITTPAAPQVVVTMEGIDIRLTWEPITESTEGCPVAVTCYLVFYSPSSVTPFYYHGYTIDTTYVHVGTVQFTPSMFYELQSYTGSLSPLDALSSPPDGNPYTREEILKLLHTGY